MIEYIAAQVDFPEIDLRQRLTISKGYGVTELFIPEGATIVGKSISDSGLREKDINVLTLHRDGKVIPNPKSSRVLEPNDRLLCFGKMETMKELVPEKTRKRRKPAMKKLKNADIKAAQS
jgi:ribosomal protein S6--L-glutamate ligase